MKYSVLRFSLIMLALLCLATSALAENAAQGDPLKLDTVTVTARKVATDKQNISASVSVFDGATLEDLAIDNLAEVVTLTPNVNFIKMDAHTIQYTFRGIGGTVNMNKVYYVNLDDVSVPYVATDTLLDVERIELLRGGQGALYGRNTHTGLINVITRDPEFTPTTFEAQASYEKFNTYRVESVVGGAASDNLAYRLALAYRSTDGYYSNTFLDRDDSNDSNQITGRAKLLFTPQNLGRFTLSLYADQFDAAFDSYGPIGAEVSHNTQNNEPGENTGSIISPTLKWERSLANGVNITSITNYSHSTYDFVHDWDFSPLDIVVGFFDETFNVVSQELRFYGGEEKSLQWLVGVFGKYEDLETESRIENGIATGPFAGTFDQQNSTVVTTNLAVFGQVVYRVLPQLEITGALRVDYEQKDLEWQNQSTTGTPMVNHDDNQDWLALSPALSAAWIFSENQRVYGLVARGFKAGDYNNVMPVPLVATSDPVDPEYTLTYELGYKGRFLDERLEFSAAAFYIDWTDMQVDLRIPGTGFYEKLNAGEAHSSGIELEARARPLSGWTIFAGLGYMFDYEFDEFNNGDIDLSGKNLPYTNAYTISLGTTYNTGSGFFFGVDAAYRGDYYLIEDNSQKQDAYLMVNANAGWAAENWEVSLFARNLLDEVYATSSFNGALMAGEPLTFGVAVKIKF